MQHHAVQFRGRRKLQECQRPLRHGTSFDLPLGVCCSLSHGIAESHCDQLTSSAHICSATHDNPSPGPPISPYSLSWGLPPDLLLTHVILGGATCGSYITVLQRARWRGLPDFHVWPRRHARKFTAWTKAVPEAVCAPSTSASRSW